MTPEEQIVFDRHIAAATQASMFALEALSADPDKEDYDLVRLGRLDVVVQTLLLEDPPMREVIRQQFIEEDVVVDD